MIRYVVIPGYITSQHDKQRHYIGPMTLIQLYGVNPRECLIYNPAPYWTASQWQTEIERRKGLIQLKPRSDDNYTLPTKTGY